LRRCFGADVLSVRPVFVPVKDRIRENGRDGGRYDETDDGSFVQAAARLQTLTIHHGRHTYISHALAGGRTLAEVRDAAGHCNVSITSGYLHVAVDDEKVTGSLFLFI
jgi:integrase